MSNYPKLDWKTRLLARLLRLSKPLEQMSIEELRQASEHQLSPVTERLFGGKLIELHQVVNLTVRGRHGNVPIRIYYPSAQANLPIVLYMHGGGWVYGNLQVGDRLCRRISQDAGAVVVSVDYKLAPFFKYPTAVEDCYDVLFWMTQNLSDLNADPGKVTVMGDSAGGNLATVLCLMAKEQNYLSIAKQVLIYPVTSGQLDRPSVAENADAPVLTRERMQFFIDSYARDTRDLKDAYFSPLLAKNLSNLPPALIVTCEYDLLHDQGEAYARRLKEAGNSVKLIDYPGTIHGFLSFPPFCKEASPAFKEIAEFIVD